MKKNILSKILILIILFLGINACSTDDLEPSLDQNKSVESDIKSEGDLYALIKGAYNRMTDDGYWGRDIIIINEVRTDNCFSNGSSGRFVTSASFSYNDSDNYHWYEAYRVIAVCNLILGQDITLLEGNQEVMEDIQGQAYALRALAHFDLLKQYGQMHTGGTLGVPYVTEFLGDDPIPARKTIPEVLSLIYADLDAAYLLLTNTDKVYISKLAAKAIESRVALYFEDWQKVIDACELVMTGGYSILPGDDYVDSWYVDESANSIFELAFSDVDNQSSNSLGFIYRGDTYGDVQVIDEVAGIYSDDDVRAGILEIVDGRLRNMHKFPSLNGADNVNVIRYEEVVLNYAEALMETGNISEALTQLNSIPENRGADLYTAVTKDNLLFERRKEFIFEGLRFDDLVRTGQSVDKEYFQQAFETIPYGDFRLALPIPKDETDANSNMEQNTGY